MPSNFTPTPALPHPGEGEKSQPLIRSSWNDTPSTRPPQTRRQRQQPTHFGIPMRVRNRSSSDWPPGRGPFRSGISRIRGGRPSPRIASTSARISRATRSVINTRPTPGSARPWASNCRASAALSAAPPGIPARAKASRVRPSAMTKKPRSLMAFPPVASGQQKNSPLLTADPYTLPRIMMATIRP
jgi:hypothetical protein